MFGVPPCVVTMGEVALWRAAIAGQEDAVRARHGEQRVSVTVRPLEADVEIGGGREVTWPPERFRRWDLTHYVLLQKLIKAEARPLDEDALERYSNILDFLRAQEFIEVQLAATDAENSNDPGEEQLLIDLCDGTVAALGDCDAKFLRAKLQVLLPDGADPLMNPFEAQVSHPHSCRHWPLRKFCRAGKNLHSEEKWKVLVQHEIELVHNVAQNLVRGLLSPDERQWLELIGLELKF
eukprot:s7087_g1.t1